MSTSAEKEYTNWLRLYFYGTNPIWAIAAVTTFVFSVITIVHLALLFLKRAWFFLPLINACLCMYLCFSPADLIRPDRTCLDFSIHRFPGWWQPRDAAAAAAATAAAEAR
jgi:hypothetical protein